MQKNTSKLSLRSLQYIVPLEPELLSLRSLQYIVPLEPELVMSIFAYDPFSTETTYFCTLDITSSFFFHFFFFFFIFYFFFIFQYFLFS